MSQSSATADTTKGELVTPEGTQEGKNTCHLAAIKLQSLPMVSPKNSGCENKILVSDSWGAYQRNDFSEPKLLQLSMCRKCFILWLWISCCCCCCCLVAKLHPTLASPRTVAYQAPLSMGFPRQEYWSGLPFPSPGNLPDPGIRPVFPALVGRFVATSITCEALWISCFL